MKGIENYKKEISKRIGLMISMAVLGLVAILFCNFYLKNIFPVKADETDYLLGFFTGFELVCVFFIARLIRIYKDDKALMKMYLKENDEREILIKMKSGFFIVPLLSMIIVLVSFITAYFSREAFIALQAVALVQIIVSLLLKIYWKINI